MGVIERAGHLHVSSPYLQDALRPDLPAVLRRARAAGLTVSLDPGWDPREVFVDLVPVLDAVDVFLPNEEEALRISGAPDVDGALAALAARVPLVVVKRGPRGAVAAEDGRTLAVAASPVEVVDATGAGDGFNAGFLWARLAGRPVEECLRAGAFAGAAATRAPGGTTAFPTAAELRAAVA